MMTPDEIARGLGPKQKAVLLSLPENGDWGKACDSRCARRMFYHKHTLIFHRHMTDNCWGLAPLGLAVRQILQEQPDAFQAWVAEKRVEVDALGKQKEQNND